MTPNIHTVILDIEGTTTPISFVHDVLFPYIRDNLVRHINQKWGSEELKQDIKELYKLYLEDNKASELVVNNQFNTPEILNPDDESTDKEKLIESVIRNVIYQMDNDRKSTPLKQLQGHMWLEGYENELVKGVVFPEVPKAFENWNLNHIDIYIYSSGSIAAQKLLFNYSNFGSLLPYIKGHFDTTIGGKLHPSSYEKILSTINNGSPNSYLFVTDSILEAKAARESGLNVCLSIRDGNPPIVDRELLNTFDQVSSFDQLFNKFNFKN
ncbi:2,3-diketo-5-methylthio-1-phosphopentane enolase [Dictyostelium discoideum AX4]|uniref:Enolase-phosphatase E1 n=1 Tax=Dictyostelium discoideum TaxID=44689 RepID=ENOPH_DICDI|nr:2,3-diketo-5-methylthio-1-phosphopentane enolase [Dictyostelium discoideum AX4]Q55FM6.1 RecName: Full=Enolase-phosphatase E1; AltName: Full=2,3-diketo-5-methylthio-1-phosphopentane phosphatase [Dictyostelium discoideum]EAL73471.1 2,3-diketo-5-methylthio-1-phosphopentane enolase [Dictyostelium discoideum AX4]|eukprot:XP_647507.1 2,3-diketo-5-methylthio-1-phosphopentane enolase [Dictyostelium discoideum AX4]